MVQGGTFLNDAVLRSFELELGAEVIRPTIAGIMGAYGAALAAKDYMAKHPEQERSALLTAENLESFAHTAKSTQCGLCGNHCQLTVNSFGGGRRFISGNRCERPLGKGKEKDIPNLYHENMPTCVRAGRGKPARAHRHPDGAQHVREPAVLACVPYEARL